MLSDGEKLSLRETLCFLECYFGGAKWCNPCIRLNLAEGTIVPGDFHSFCYALRLCHGCMHTMLDHMMEAAKAAGGKVHYG
jgi:hypothetical protein